MTTRKQMQTTLDLFYIALNEVTIRRNIRAFNRLMRLARRIDGLAADPSPLLRNCAPIMDRVECVPLRLADVRQSLKLN